jgi:hypothetical protein
MVGRLHNEITSCTPLNVPLFDNPAVLIYQVFATASARLECRPAKSRRGHGVHTVFINRKTRLGGGWSGYSAEAQI